MKFWRILFSVLGYNFRCDAAVGMLLVIVVPQELNDGQGHQAGDEALMYIGKCIKKATDYKTQAYRVGGDEFLLLFFHNNEKTIKEVGERIKESVSRKGYHISIGYALLAQDTDLNAAISKSDKLMYEDKARYYQETGKNRRRR